MDKANILLVDDQPGKLMAYEAILTDLGENLVVARSGREALKCLLAQEFALVLLDVVMPDMDGFETAVMIRQRPRSEQTPIIFLTAYSTSDIDKLKGYELGAVDYVFAPIIPEILRAKVSVFVELYRKRQELADAIENLRKEILERKRAEEQALQAERLAAVGQMVAGLAHESRNALQQIQGAVEMLSRRILSEPESTLIGGIQRASDRLLRLLEDVRVYSAPIKLSREINDLCQLWEEAWNQLQHLSRGRDIAFLADANGLDLRCHLDAYSIERVFRNILENSLGACHDPAKIGVSCTAANLNGHEGVRLRFTDNGPGLSAEQKQRIFEPFYTTKTRGTGLGMAIAKRIVEAHGGEIAVGESPNPGAAIDVILPRGRE